MMTTDESLFTSSDKFISNLFFYSTVVLEKIGYV